jgi:hypothetical protein
VTIGSEPDGAVSNHDRDHASDDSRDGNVPIACSLEPGALRQRRDALLPGLVARADRVEAIDAGYRLRFPDAAALTTVAAVVDAERQCCRFLEFRLTIEPGGGPMWLEVTGPPGTKEFLADLFA